MHGLDAQKYFVAVIDDRVLDGAVVLSAAATKDACTLRYCYPIYQTKSMQLAASGYTPMLRFKIPMAVGIDECGGIPYAYCSAKLPPYGSAVDLFDALVRIGRELEAFLTHTKAGES